jgi:predicted dehydrogenase
MTNSEKKIKLAIIGGSFDSTISKTHLRSILASNKYEIICGCFSRNKNKNKLNIKNYNLPEDKIYNDLNKLLKLESKNIDLAVVLTPPNERYKIYYKLAKKNIGIIAEKPFEANLTKAIEVYKFLKKKNIFFVSTYNYLGYPAIMEIKNLIKKIGKISNLIIEMPQQASTLSGSNIKKWRTKDLNIPNLHLDLASHLMSFIIYFFNELPYEVNSFEIKNLKKNYVDNSYTWLKFKNFIGNLWYSKNATGKKNELSIQIYGTKGSLHWEHKNCEEIIQYDNKGNKTTINRLSKNIQYLNNKKLFTYSAGHPSGFLDAFINIYENIYNLYRRKPHLPIFINLKNNLDILSVLDIIHSSSNKRIWQKVFLEK